MPGDGKDDFKTLMELVTMIKQDVLQPASEMPMAWSDARIASHVEDFKDDMTRGIQRRLLPLLRVLPMEDPAVREAMMPAATKLQEILVDVDAIQPTRASMTASLPAISEKFGEVQTHLEQIGRALNATGGRRRRHRKTRKHTRRARHTRRR